MQHCFYWQTNKKTTSFSINRTTEWVDLHTGLLCSLLKESILPLFVGLDRDVHNVIKGRKANCKSMWKVWSNACICILYTLKKGLDIYSWLLTLLFSGTRVRMENNDKGIVSVSTFHRPPPKKKKSLNIFKWPDQIVDMRCLFWLALLLASA